MKEALDFEIRKKIYDLIAKNPGLHFSKIAEMLGLRTSLAEYHLNYLEKNKLVISLKEPGGYYRRYYVKDGEIGVEDKKILSILRQELPLKIILYLLRTPYLRHRDILKRVDITSSTLSYHIMKLMSHGVIDVASKGEYQGYVLRNRRKVIRLLLTYEFDIIVDDFKDVWEHLTY